MYTIANDQEFVDTLKQEENTKSSFVTYPTGWTGKGWIAYPSREGGAPTIGYGHKLNNGQTTLDIKDKDGKVVRTVNLLTEEITDKQAHDLLIQDIISHEKKAMKEWTKHTPIDGVAWHDLDATYRGMMTEIVFNVGTLENPKEVTRKGVTYKPRTTWGWTGLAGAIKAGNVESALKNISRKHKGKQLGRIKPFQDVWRPRLHKMVADLHPDGGPTNKYVDKAKFIFPEFDKLPRGKQVSFLSQVIKREREIEDEEAKEQSANNYYIDKMNQVSIERDAEVLEVRKQQAADKAIEEEEALLLKDEAPVDETSKVITEKLADVQYFMKEDGSVVKLDSKGTILE